MGRVAGKVAVVTGGASGLGQATAGLLQKEGAQVVITDVNEPAGRVLAEKIGCDFFLQDVAEERGWLDLMAFLSRKYGGLQVLVNNAGIGEGSGANDPEGTSLADFDLVYSVNVGGTFLGCKHAIPIMRNGGMGSIINMSSIAALVSTPFLTAYGASKAAVRQLTMSVAAYCAENNFGIRCNSIHPGQIKTPMLEKVFSELATVGGGRIEDIEEEFVRKVPLGALGEPEDVAHMALYLASDESSYITGTQMLVDGGMLARS